MSKTAAQVSKFAVAASALFAAFGAAFVGAAGDDSHWGAPTVADSHWGATPADSHWGATPADSHWGSAPASTVLNDSHWG